MAEHDEIIQVLETMRRARKAVVWNALQRHLCNEHMPNTWPSLHIKHVTFAIGGRAKDECSRGRLV